MADFNDFYPDVFTKRKRRLQDEYLVVTTSNFFEFCKDANRQFEFLITHENKSGLYFIDWRTNFSNLKKFVLEFKEERKSIFYHQEIERFLFYFSVSAELLYSREI